MDVYSTPQPHGITSEDSGCHTTATFESSSEWPSKVGSYDSPLGASFKRKLGTFRSVPPTGLISVADTSPGPFRKDAHPSFLSSTLNESLRRSFEECILESPEHEDELAFKRCRFDDEGSSFQPRTRSAPSTPTKQLEEVTDLSIAKSKSENLDEFFVTPRKSGSFYKPYRLGSPERAELLYSNLKPVSPPPKLKTPQKFQESLKKYNSPIKKRLFEPGSVRVDPFVLLYKKNNYINIACKIFSYLADSDLYNVSMVSTTWKGALMTDHRAHGRYYSYVERHRSNKENYLVRSPKAFESPGSPPVSPGREKFYRCTKLASTLLPDQSLHMCPQCMHPSVITQNIGQCQNPNCEYIYCRCCSSFSTTGPEGFEDKCQQSKLVINGGFRNSLNRTGLFDVSNIESDDFPSFLKKNESSFHTPSSRRDSSGYLSESSNSSPRTRVRRNLALKDKLGILRDTSNTHQDLNCSFPRTARRASLVSVVSINDGSKIIDIAEASSPPRVKNVACSKQSKKNLKRLQF